MNLSCVGVWIFPPEGRSYRQTVWQTASQVSQTERELPENSVVTHRQNEVADMVCLFEHILTTHSKVVREVDGLAYTVEEVNLDRLEKQIQVWKVDLDERWGSGARSKRDYVLAHSLVRQSTWWRLWECMPLMSEVQVEDNMLWCINGERYSFCQRSCDPQDKSRRRRRQAQQGKVGSHEQEIQWKWKRTVTGGQSGTCLKTFSMCCWCSYWWRVAAATEHGWGTENYEITTAAGNQPDWRGEKVVMCYVCNVQILSIRWARQV